MKIGKNDNTTKPISSDANISNQNQVEPPNIEIINNKDETDKDETEEESETVYVTGDEGKVNKPKQLYTSISIEEDEEIENTVIERFELLKNCDITVVNNTKIGSQEETIVEIKVTEKEKENNEEPTETIDKDSSFTSQESIDVTGDSDNSENIESKKKKRKMINTTNPRKSERISKNDKAQSITN